ncbi:MAG TPA: oligosaccharide flippase family protein [Armatimonadota bacterium]
MTVAIEQPEIDQIPPPPKGRFLINLIANTLNFGINVLIGLWFTPYLIHHLGIAAYGLIPLATTVIAYLGLFTIALNGAVGRYLTIALERQDTEDANKIFNTSLVGSIIVILLLIVPTLLLSGHASWFFTIPAGYQQQFSWLFLCSVGLFLLTTFSSVFSISSFCRNRFDLANTVSIATNLIRIGVVVAMFSLFLPAVWHVGAGMLVAGFVGVIGSIIVWRYLTPMLRIQPALFNIGTLRQLTSTGGWVVVNQIGTLLYLCIDLIVVNRLIGAEAGGQYGALLQWSTLLRGIAGTVAGVFAPTIIAFYAQHDLSGLVQYSQRAVKMLGLVIALPIGLICGLSRPLLHAWLGPEFAALSPLLSLMTIHLCVNLGVLPLFNIQVATNNVRLPGILTCVMGAMNLGLALWLAGPVGWGMYGVAAAGAIMLTAKNLLFTPLYGAHILGIGHGTFFRATIPIIVATLGLTASGWGIASLFPILSWTALFGVGAILTCLYLGFTYLILLTKEERGAALRLLAPRLVLHQ